MQALKSVCFGGLHIVCFQKPLEACLLFSKALEKLSPLYFPASAMLGVLLPVPVTLSQHLYSLLSYQSFHALPPGRAATPTLAFPAFSFLK